MRWECGAPACDKAAEKRAKPDVARPAGRWLQHISMGKDLQQNSAQYFSYLRFLLALHEENKLSVFFALFQQIITGLFRERLKITHRTRISRQHTEYFATEHVRQRLLGFQNRQWAMQAARVEFFIKFHNHFVVM
jgi:hypothetical protein